MNNNLITDKEVVAALHAFCEHIDVNSLQKDLMEDMRIVLESFKKQHKTTNSWNPIDTAPTDNKRLLYLARFDAKGVLLQLDFDGIWEHESGTYEMPENYWYWAGSNNVFEEPTHWAYQDEGIPVVSITPTQIPSERKYYAVLARCGDGVIFDNMADAKWAATGVGAGQGGFGYPAIAGGFRDCYGDEEFVVTELHLNQSVSPLVATEEDMQIYGSIADGITKSWMVIPTKNKLVSDSDLQTLIENFGSRAHPDESNDYTTGDFALATAVLTLATNNLSTMKQQYLNYIQYNLDDPKNKINSYIAADFFTHASMTFENPTLLYRVDEDVFDAYMEYKDDADLGSSEGDQFHWFVLLVGSATGEI